MITKIMITFSTWPISSSLDQSQPFLPPFKKQLWSLVLNIWGYPHWFWIYEAILSPIHWFRHMYCEWLSSTHYLQLSRMFVCWRCHLWTSVPLSLSYKYIVCWDRAFLQHIFDIFGSTSGRHNCFQITTRWWLLFHSHYCSIFLYQFPIFSFSWNKKAICANTKIRSFAKRVNKHQHQMHMGDKTFCHGTAIAELSNHIWDFFLSKIASAYASHINVFLLPIFVTQVLKNF